LRVIGTGLANGFDRDPRKKSIQHRYIVETQAGIDA
jgi:hypothetical protein